MADLHDSIQETLNQAQNYVNDAAGAKVVASLEDALVWSAHIQGSTDDDHSSVSSAVSQPQSNAQAQPQSAPQPEGSPGMGQPQGQ